MIKIRYGYYWRGTIRYLLILIMVLTIIVLLSNVIATQITNNRLEREQIQEQQKNQYYQIDEKDKPRSI